MTTKWIAILLLAVSAFTTAGCAGSYRVRYRQPVYYRYDSRPYDHHYDRHDYRDRDWDRNRPR